MKTAFINIRTKKGQVIREPLIEAKKVAEIIEKYTSEQVEGYPNELKERELEYMRLHIDRYVETLRLVPKLDEPENIKVFDIGILAGHMAIAVSKLFGYEIFGIDLEGEETCHWRKRFISNDIEFTVCDITKEPIPFEDGLFDIVLFSEVMEHLTICAKDILKEINRILKMGGVLILSTPNFTNAVNRIRFLLGDNPIDIRRCNPPVGHYREYTAGECLYLLRRSGFEIEEWSYKYIPYHRWFFDFVYQLCRLIPSMRNILMIRARKKGSIESAEGKLAPLLTDFKPSWSEIVKRFFRPEAKFEAS